MDIGWIACWPQRPPLRCARSTRGKASPADPLSASPRPFYLAPLADFAKGSGFLRKDTDLDSLVKAYGAEAAKWQFASGGTYTVPPLWRTGCPRTFCRSSRRLWRCEQWEQRVATKRTIDDTPMFHPPRGADDDPCDAEFREAFTLDHPPSTNFQHDRTHGTASF